MELNIPKEIILFNNPSREKMLKVLKNKFLSISFVKVVKEICLSNKVFPIS